MPSLRDLDTADGSVADPAGSTPPDDVLAAVKVEGGRRRARRHRRNSAVTLLGVALLAVPALALLRDGGDDQQLTVAADDEDSSTSTTDATPTTVATTATTAATIETAVVAPPDTATTIPPTRPTTTPATPRTTVPPLMCQNSTNPACGPFHWDPAVGNQALSASFVSAPGTAVVGEPVTFEVDWSDPDANAFDNVHSVDGASIGAPCTVPERYGAWTPPSANAGSGRISFTETFATTGEHRVVVDLWTGDVCAHPYASERHIETIVTVTDPEAPPSG